MSVNLIQITSNKLGEFIQRNCVQISSISIGIIYTWFGVLKFFPGYSPAEALAQKTLTALTLNTISPETLLLLLGIVELFIGITLIINVRKRFLFYAILIHMIGTFLPFFLFPELTFNKPPLGFSIVGQYIMKNLVILSGVLIIFVKKST